MSVPAGAAFDNAIRDCYWDAGWGGTEQTVTRNVATGKCNVRPGADAKYKTYFVDLCRLTSRAEVEKLVLTPMQALFENAFEESFASLRPHLVEYRSTDK